MKLNEVHSKPNTWNYRIMRHPDEGGEPVYGIHEVYYGEEGKVNQWTDHPSAVASSKEELASVLQMMQRALLEEEIDMQDFQPYQPLEKDST